MQEQLKKGFVKNLSYNVLAVVLLNIVIQFAVYPYLNNVLGGEVFGTVLYLLSVVAIFAGSFGMATNNARLVIKPQFESKNGDYNSILLIFCILSTAAAIVVLILLQAATFINILFFSLLSVVNLIRYYSDVEYRLSLKYRQYFLFYMIISAGYLLGILFFRATTIWYLALITGEALAVCFVLLKGSIYREPFTCSENRKKVWRNISIIAVSYLISNFFLNIDRILLLNVLGGETVTTFYTASVLGKTLALLVGPLNGVLIAYLANYEGQLSKKAYGKISLITIAFSAAAFFACVLVSPWLIRLLYPNVYEQAYGLIWLGTLGQVVFSASTLLLAIILRFCDAKYQFNIQLVYGIVYLAVAIPATIFGGIYGFAYATLAANLVRFLLVLLTGLKGIQEKVVSQEDGESINA